MGSPLAIGTVLLFYFGWVRATRQARRLGYDTTVLDLTTADYLLKSVNVLFVPLVALLLVGLLAHQVHSALMAVAARQTIVRTIQHAWLALLAVGIIGYIGVPSADDLTLPFSLTVIVGGYLYGRAVAIRTLAAPPLKTTRRILLVGILALSIFWDVEVVASRFGGSYADGIAARTEYLPAATIYSKDSLLISGPGVQEKKIAQADTTYHYLYTGLMLVQRSSDRYFLLAVGTTPDSGKMIIIKDSETIRIELDS